MPTEGRRRVAWEREEEAAGFFDEGEPRRARPSREYFRYAINRRIMGIANMLIDEL